MTSAEQHNPGMVVMRAWLQPLLVFALAAGSSFAAGRADVLPASARQPSIELAQRLSSPAHPSSLPADLKSPFNPPGFDMPDPEEEGAKTTGNSAANESHKPRNDRELLEAIADGIHPSGTFQVGREQIILISKKKFKVGDRLSISFDDRDYEIEISSIDRTTFSLRLNRAETSRPIQPGKTP
jgi:hypothetical protein